jgi:menaquinone-dependent protoporphyrinogen IX oxidase
MGFWNKLKRKLFGYSSFEDIELSPRGECILQYCESIIRGEEVYIEAYEEELNNFIKINNNKFDRRTAAAMYVEILTAIQKKNKNIITKCI